MIALIEQAIKDRIAKGGLGYLRAVESYGGQFDEGLAKVVRNFPAVWVAFKGDSDPKATDTTREVWHVPSTFFVMVGARSLQNDSAPRQGGVKIGTYQMLNDVRALLLQQDFGLPIKELWPGRTTTLVTARYQNDGISILAQEWHTVYPLEVRKPDRVARYDNLCGPDGTGGAGDTGGTGGPAAYRPGPDGTTLPPLLVPDLHRIGLNYYLRPPAEDPAEPDATDLLTLQKDTPDE